MIALNHAARTAEVERNCNEYPHSGIDAYLGGKIFMYERQNTSFPENMFTIFVNESGKVARRFGFKS